MSRRQLLAGLAAGMASGAIADPPGDDWLRDPAHEAILHEQDRLVAESAAVAQSDPLHPAFHFAPAGRFMNDPNGCVTFNRQAHMFYQHLPMWGEPNAQLRPSWGHAVSRDLLHWTHLPIALAPRPGTYDAEAVASGACVIDQGRPTIVYTSVPPQAQSLARSFDGMRTWRHYRGNPVVGTQPPIPGLLDGFRDPTLWRENDEWRMLVGSGIREVGGTVLMYRSPNLLNWEFMGPLCTGMGPDCFQWECPAFFPLDGKWVLVVSPLLHSEPALRGPVQYSVGSYDGKTFTPGPWQILDHGGPGIFYAPNTLVDTSRRRVLFGWIMGGGSPGTRWDGLLTLPRHLYATRSGRMGMKPISGFDRLRQERLADLGSGELATSGRLVARGTQLDLVVEPTPRSAGVAELHLLASNDGARSCRIVLDLARRKLECNGRSAPLDAGEPGPMRVIVDRSVVEVYCGFSVVLTMRYAPAAGEDAVIIRQHGSAVNRLQAYRIKRTM